MCLPSSLLPLCQLSMRCMGGVNKRLAAALAGKRLQEPAVAVQVACKGIRAGGALFISSSMPIRDLDMYAAAVGAAGTPLYFLY